MVCNRVCNRVVTKKGIGYCLAIFEQGHNLEFGGGNEKVDYAADLEDKNYMNRPNAIDDVKMTITYLSHVSPSLIDQRPTHTGERARITSASDTGRLQVALHNDKPMSHVVTATYSTTVASIQT
jgi:hypothetical protein